MDAKQVSQLPVARQFVICADAILRLPTTPDLIDGFWELHDPLHTVWMPSGIQKGFSLLEIWVYLQLTGGFGRYNLDISVEEMDLANPRRDRVLVRSAPVVISLGNTWDVVQQAVTLRRVPFPRPGQYRIRLTTAGVDVPGGSVYLRVMPGEMP